jgi:hypothetical protein
MDFICVAEIQQCYAQTCGFRVNFPKNPFGTELDKGADDFPREEDFYDNPINFHNHEKAISLFRSPAAHFKPCCNRVQKR